MQCPHCRADFEGKFHTFALGMDPDGTWQVSSVRCPTCDRLIINLCTDQGCTFPAWPVSSVRPPLSDDVPVELTAEYHTASQILAFSPEASSAMSRRLLHRFLAEHVGAGTNSLAQQIDQANRMAEIPQYVKQALRALAQVARLDEDQAKSARPEALAPVRRGEADWVLDVLEMLFDLYFVQPAAMERKRALLEERSGLVGAGTAADAGGEPAALPAGAASEQPLGSGQGLPGPE